MGTPRFGRWFRLVALGVAVLISISVAYSAGAASSPDLAGVTKAGGKTVTQVKLVRGDLLVWTSSTSYVAVPGATATVTVPVGSKALIIARFAAISDCTDSNGNVTGGYSCNLRVLVNGQEAAPAGAQSSIFDATAADGREAHAIERSRGPLGPGTYVVTVQYSVAGATVTFDLDGWTLEVDRVKV
jgi:hypothetical protein